VLYRRNDSTNVDRISFRFRYRTVQYCSGSLTASVADRGCLSRIPDSIFSLPDPGSATLDTAPPRLIGNDDVHESKFYFLLDPARL
jgi:hypothetical protein